MTKRRKKKEQVFWVIVGSTRKVPWFHMRLEKTKSDAWFGFGIDFYNKEEMAEAAKNGWRCVRVRLTEVKGK